MFTIPGNAPPERLNLSCEKNSIQSCKKRIFEAAKEYPAEKMKSLPKKKKKFSIQNLHREREAPKQVTDELAGISEVGGESGNGRGEATEALDWRSD